MTESSPFLSFIDQCVEAQNNSLVSKVKRRRTLLSSPLIRSNPHVIHKIRPRVKFQPADCLSLPRDILKNNKTATKKPIRGSTSMNLKVNDYSESALVLNLIPTEGPVYILIGQQASS